MNTEISQKINSTMTFGNGDKPWIIRLTQEGIEFNRKDYPEWKPDDFANQILDILEFLGPFKLKDHLSKAKKGAPYE